MVTVRLYLIACIWYAMVSDLKRPDIAFQNLKEDRSEDDQKRGRRYAYTAFYAYYSKLLS